MRQAICHLSWTTRNGRFTRCDVRVAAPLRARTIRTTCSIPCCSSSGVAPLAPSLWVPCAAAMVLPVAGARLGWLEGRLPWAAQRLALTCALPVLAPALPSRGPTGSRRKIKEASGRHSEQFFDGKTDTWRTTRSLKPDKHLRVARTARFGMRRCLRLCATLRWAVAIGPHWGRPTMPNHRYCLLLAWCALTRCCSASACYAAGSAEILYTW